MSESVGVVFQKNIRIMAGIGRAIIYIREGKYEEAIDEVSEVTEDISFVADSIMKNREYFELVSVESIGEMIQGILDAKHNCDYILLADLLELQMENFICSVQNYIMSKEELHVFDEEKYQRQLTLLQSQVADPVIFGQDFVNELNTAELLEEGYRIEFTSCGLMTLAAKDSLGKTHYLHTNHKITQEAFLLAKSWKEDGISTYIMNGLGLAYHILELRRLDAEAKIEIYESDMNIFKLCCAFSNIEDLLNDNRVSIIYDPDYQKFEQRKLQLDTNEKVCIHRPSYERIE